jgi:type IV fimbrial biogenesis protein FimT
MLKKNRDDHGFTLVELLVGMGMLAVLMSLAMPNFTSWVRNSKLRTAAESIQNGLQLTRAEAVRRNRIVRFQLVSSACEPDPAGTSWLISLDEAGGNCEIDPAGEAAPRAIQFRDGSEGSASDGKMKILSEGGISSYAFNGEGRLVGPPSSINITSNVEGLACKAAGGSMRCLRVTVSAGGQVRMCDPALPSSDPQAC